MLSSPDAVSAGKTTSETWKRTGDIAPAALRRNTQLGLRCHTVARADTAMKCNERLQPMLTVGNPLYKVAASPIQCHKYQGAAPASCCPQ